jgi:predicted transcriptional regulator
MKQEFLDFVNELMKANPELTEKLMTDNVKAYLDVLKEVKDEKPELTENGKLILYYLQNHLETRLWKAKDIAEQMGISSRGASGTLRKLVNDGFCEKLGAEPVIYALTEKGKTFIIETDEE